MRALINDKVGSPEYHNLKDAKVVVEEHIYCEGPQVSPGHPRVYLYVDKEDGVICPYCNQMFIYKEL